MLGDWDGDGVRGEGEARSEGAAVRDFSAAVASVTGASVTAEVPARDGARSDVE